MDSITKVYAVVTGECDPKVRAVFTTEALAQSFVLASAGSFREPRIEEYELDPANDWGDVYEVHMDRNGGIFVASPIWTHLPHGWWNFDVRRPEYWVLRHWVSASDRHVAIEATKAMRDQLIADGRWPDPEAVVIQTTSDEYFDDGLYAWVPSAPADGQYGWRRPGYRVSPLEGRHDGR